MFFRNSAPTLKSGKKLIRKTPQKFIMVSQKFCFACVKDIRHFNDTFMGNNRCKYISKCTVIFILNCLEGKKEITVFLAHNLLMLTLYSTFFISIVADTDPSDPYVFRPHGSADLGPHQNVMDPQHCL
jgi:hypothetical protein